MKQKPWNELKEGIVGAANRVCEIVKMRKGEKRLRWWNEQVRGIDLLT